MSEPRTPDEDDEEDYYLPAQSARAFGAGIKRKRVAFIPASDTTESTLPSTTTATQPTNAGARYLSIVLAQESHDKPSPSPSLSTDTTSTATPNAFESYIQRDDRVDICPICALPLTGTTIKSHESSIAHQISLEHSHPPSHLDRQRKGLKYLEGFGWDPDSRLGLGARSEGIRVPVKAKEKRDTTGLGLFSEQRGDEGDSGMKKVVTKREEHKRPQRLNAKQVRKLEEEKKIKAEKLRKTFYAEDLSQYLGSGG